MIVARMKKTAIVYWLLPAKPQRDLFCDVIRILRRAFDAPSFEPHLTLFVAGKNQESPKKVLQQIRARPIRLSVRGVAYSPKYTKTLFVRFKSAPQLRKLTADLARKAAIDPHVSLLYKKIPQSAKKQLAAVIKLPFRNVVFDTVAAVRLKLPVRTGADVRKWKIVAKKSLRR